MNELAQRITAALDQGTRGLDAATSARLSAIRRQAVAAGHGQHSLGQGVIAWTHDHPWRVLILVVCAAAIGWFGFQRQHADSSGEVDIQLLTDDLPPQAYAERDFAKWLKSPGR